MGAMPLFFASGFLAGWVLCSWRVMSLPRYDDGYKAAMKEAIKAGAGGYVFDEETGEGEWKWGAEC